jgi:hypothetical protein
MAVKRPLRNINAKRLRLDFGLGAPVFGAAFGGLPIGLFARLAFARQAQIDKLAHATRLFLSE